DNAAGPRRPIAPLKTASGEAAQQKFSPWFVDLHSSGEAEGIPVEAKLYRPVPREIVAASPSMEKFREPESPALATPYTQEEPLILPLIGPLAFDPGQGL